MKKTNQTSGRTKICFVAMGAYPLLAGKPTKNVVGPDVHQVLLAKEFIKHNFEVAFVTQGERGAPVEYMDGIEVIKINTKKYHLNIISKIFHIWDALRKAKADIYIHSGGAAGAVSPFCRVIKKKYVYDIASDALVSSEIITKKNVTIHVLEASRNQPPL